MKGIEKEINQFVDFLRGKGFKITPQRMRIAESVFSNHKHFTADELYARAKKLEPLIGRVTVYRTLTHLVESGMIEELALRRGVATYEHVVGHAHHDHVICLDCGKIEELRSDALEKLKVAEAEKLGFEVIAHALKIPGRCAQCQGAKPEARKVEACRFF